MLKTILIFLLATVLVALVTHHLRKLETHFSQQLLQGTEQPETTHVFTQFSLTSTDSGGTVESVIQSPHTRHVVNQYQTQLESPTMLIYRENQTPVKLTADSAVVDHQTNITTLINNVNVSMEENKRLHMTTDILTVDNADRTAKTDAPASIFYGNSRMNGVGLEFEFDNKKVKFLNKVHGTYER